MARLDRRDMERVVMGKFDSKNDNGASLGGGAARCGSSDMVT